MMLALLCAGLLAQGAGDTPPPPPTPDVTYAEMKARTGRSPEDQVRLALWCESRGLTVERLHHLSLAILADPKNVAARGLMGLVWREGRWQRPEVVAGKLKADPTLAEYEARRAKVPATADAQWALGLWCDENGLSDQAQAHLKAVVRLDPSREAAWRKLGYKKQDGRWVTDAQLASERAEAETQKLADRKWRTLLEKWRGMLDQPSKRAEAEAALSELADPRAVPMIGKVFGSNEATQPLAVRLLGQVDAPAASKGLAYLSIFARSAEARRAAAETLRNRDAREYADLLIALIRDPIRYEVKPVGGPGSPGVLFVEGQKANLKRLYQSASAVQPGDTVGFDKNGQPVLKHTLSASGFADQPNVPITERSRIAGTYQEYTDYSGSNVNGTGSFNDFANALRDPYRNGSLGFNPSLAAVSQAPSGPAVTPDTIRQLIQGGHASGGPQVKPSAPNNIQVYGLPATLGLPFANVTDFASSTTAEIPLAQAVAETQKSVQVAQGQLQADVAAIEAVNRPVRELNDRAVAVLNQATGQNLPIERRAWDKWWVDQLGYNLVAGQTAVNPTIVEVVSGYQPQVIPSNVITQTVAMNRMSCFGAGTPVRTIDGSRPIEALKVGDLVLTQSTDTGALTYKPILFTHHNPPSATFRIQIKGESIISSHFHRFWVAGRGWVMARDLKVGDPVRLLGEVAPVEAVEADRVQLVYNLDVAEDANFFAGGVAALVHDNTLPDPKLAPFDAATSAPAVARGGR